MQAVHPNTPAVIPMNNFANAAAAGGDYNYPTKPRERKLRPWVATASLAMLLFGVAQILASVLSYGDLEHTWAYLASGIACAASGVFGLLSALTLSRMLSTIFFVLTLVAWIGSWAVHTIHAIFVDDYMRDECNERDASRCQDVRDYYVATTGAFLALSFILPPATTVVAGYFWRALSRARKGLPTSSVYPYGSARP